jgi:colicin import membrane protein
MSSLRNKLKHILSLNSETETENNIFVKNNSNQSFENGSATSSVMPSGTNKLSLTSSIQHGGNINLSHKLTDKKITEENKKKVEQLVSMLTSESQTSTSELNNSVMNKSLQGGNNKPLYINSVKNFFDNLKSQGIKVDIKLNDATFSDFFNNADETSTELLESDKKLTGGAKKHSKKSKKNKLASDSEMSDTDEMLSEFSDDDLVGGKKSSRKSSRKAAKKSSKKSSKKGSRKMRGGVFELVGGKKGSKKGSKKSSKKSSKKASKKTSKKGSRKMRGGATELVGGKKASKKSSKKASKKGSKKGSRKMRGGATELVGGKKSSKKASKKSSKKASKKASKKSSKKGSKKGSKRQHGGNDTEELFDSFATETSENSEMHGGKKEKKTTDKKKKMPAGMEHYRKFADYMREKLDLTFNKYVAKLGGEIYRKAKSMVKEADRKDGAKVSAIAKELVDKNKAEYLKLYQKLQKQ